MDFMPRVAPPLLQRLLIANGKWSIPHAGDLRAFESMVGHGNVWRSDRQTARRRDGGVGLIRIHKELVEGRQMPDRIAIGSFHVENSEERVTALKLKNEKVPGLELLKHKLNNKNLRVPFSNRNITP